MSKLVVAFDVDGVVADYVGGVRSALGLPTEWNPRQWDITADPDVRAVVDWKHKLDSWNAARGTVSSLREYPEAVMLIEALRHACADIVEVIFATAPMRSSETWMHEREAWLNKRFPGAPVIHTSDKHHVSADHLLDDRPSNVLSFCRDSRTRGSGWLLRRPWNEHAQRFATFDTLEEFCQTVARFVRRGEDYKAEVTERRAIGL